MNIFFISLGCDKNLVDTEEMMGLLRDNGYHFTDDEYEADIIIINTCCFINDAKQESIEAIIEMAQVKEQGKCRSLIVTGCLATRYKDEILEEIPEIDAIVGTSSIEKIKEAIEKTTSFEPEKHFKIMENPDRLPIIPNERISTTGGYYAYLKIAEGCDRACTYCIIPKVRGRFRSLPIEFLVERTKELVAGGVSEIILVAQDLTLYGIDFAGKKKRLASLIKSLAAVDGLKWIRLLYCYPEDITDELIQIIKNEPKVCNYIDIPIQHASDSILKQMGRKVTEKELRKIIGKLRKEIPDICLRTTLITGFPGETDYDVELCKEFIDDIEFDRLGVFTYSQEEDTPAAKFSRQIPEEVKEKRRDELMILQQKISADISKRLVGHTMEVMIDGYLPEDDVYVGRTYKDAPNVDGSVFINLDEDDSREMMSGTFVKVKITGSTEYDLIGKLVK